MSEEQAGLVDLATQRIRDLRAAVVAARDVLLEADEHLDDSYSEELKGSIGQWLARFGPLGVVPEIEVEDDDDPEGTPMEGALWEKESAG